MGSGRLGEGAMAARRTVYRASEGEGMPEVMPPTGGSGCGATRISAGYVGGGRRGEFVETYVVRPTVDVS